MVAGDYAYVSGEVSVADLTKESQRRLAERKNARPRRQRNGPTRAPFHQASGVLSCLRLLGHRRVSVELSTGPDDPSGITSVKQAPPR